MEPAAVLIDGGYLNALNRDIFGMKRIDLVKLSDELCKPECSRFRTYYYNCPPYQDTPPTSEQQQRKANYDKFTSTLRLKPRFVVREGHLRLVSREPFEVEQKGIDVLFACDLVRLAAKNIIKRAIIVAGDADYVPAVYIAKEDMVITELLYVSRHCSPDLFQACDERRQLTQQIIDRASF